MESVEYALWYLQTAKPEDCPLFQSLLPEILREMELDDEVCDDDLMHRVWASIKDAFQKKVPKTGVCRWFSLADNLPKLHRTWTRKYLVTIVNCVRNDMVRNYYYYYY